MTVPAITAVEPAGPVAPAPGAARLSLGASVRLSFGTLVLLMAVLTWVAAGHTSGDARALVLALGLSGMALGTLAGAWLGGRLAAPLQDAVGAARRLSEGDLAQPVALATGGELGPLRRALEDMRQRLFAVVSQVRTGTTLVAATSSQISRDNEALSQRTHTQAESLQETAASLEQLAAAVHQTADNARQSHALAVAASERAAQGGALVAEVVETMAAIRQGSRSIVDIIGVIDGIAFQTSILALNAAVEAARAGEQGRGFAVVASEVRVLAQRSATAAREVKALIESAVRQVETGGGRVDQAGLAMTEIVAGIRQVAEFIGRIELATREQSAGIETVNQAMARIERTTQGNAALVKDAARTAATLNEQAVALLKSVSAFELGAREHGSAQEAVEMVRRGCEFLQSHGRDALVEDVNRLGRGSFVDRDLYLMVIRADDHRFVAHGNNPRTLGLGPQSKDADGKAFVQEMVRTALTRGDGWVDYKWAHPVTNELLTKSSYVRLAGDVVVACGVYKR